MHGETSITLGSTTRGLTLDAPVALTLSDRRRHLHIIGRTGTGKSTLLLALMRADLAAGRGFALLDPHGDLAEAILDAVPPDRVNDVLYLNPADLAHPVGLNPLFAVPADARPLAAAQIVATFKHLWADSWGPRLEYILLNAVRLLLDAPDATLLGLPRLLVDDAYRRRLLATCRDPVVAAFWRQEFAGYSDRLMSEAISPLQNKVGALLSPPALRNVLGQKRSTVDLARIMNGGRILIANLAKGRIGEGPSHLIGAVLASGFAQAAEGRAAMPETERRDFALYVDEFQNFATDSFAAILSEARKWRLSLILAHQYLGQLPEPLRLAVLGNVGSLVAFRIGAEDAAAMAPELGIEHAMTLADTANFSAWARILRHGNPEDPLLLRLPAPDARLHGRGDAILARTRARHTRPRALVEAAIGRFLASSPNQRERDQRHLP